MGVVDLDSKRCAGAIMADRFAYRRKKGRMDGRHVLDFAGVCIGVPTVNRPMVDTGIGPVK
jgi:hypothetical protein